MFTSTKTTKKLYSLDVTFYKQLMFSATRITRKILFTSCNFLEKFGLLFIPTSGHTLTTSI